MSEATSYLLSILRESQGKTTDEELRKKITQDINNKLGPYYDYSAGYRITRFDKDLKELIERGFIRKTDGNLEAPSEVLKLAERFPKRVAPSNIPSRLHEYKRSGQALKLEVLRLMCLNRESHILKQELNGFGWTEKAIETVLRQLDSEGMLKYPELKFKNHEIANEVKSFVTSYEKEIQEISISKKTEAAILNIRFQPKKKARKFQANSVGVMNLLLEFADECRNRNIEIISIGLGQIEALFNQVVYRFFYNEGVLGDIPYFDVDHVVFLCNKTDSNFVPNYLREWNVEKWGKSATYSFDRLEKFNFSDDLLFQFFENFLHERYDLVFDAPPLLFEEVQKRINELNLDIKRQREELSKKKIYDEGLIYTKPDFPWPLGNKINEFFSKATSIVRICNPYCDDSTFNQIVSIRKDLKILLLVTEDDRLDGKVKSKILTRIAVEKALKDRRTEIKVIPNLHSRFVIIDNAYLLFLSPDLQTRSLMSKYEYGYWTNNDEIIKDSIAYFDLMWSEALPFNITDEIGKHEK
jgi:hypothetical protein